MDLSFFIELVKEYGYVSMFLINWLLLFGMPLPNEVAATFSGVVTEINHFKPVYAFLAAYLGLISSNTFAYFIGFTLGMRLLRKLKETRWNKAIQKFDAFLVRRGKWAIFLSFFLPGFRWAMPYVVGANRFPFLQYAFFAYTGSFVWMMVYFNLGRTFPYAYDTILSHLQLFFVSLSLVIALVITIRSIYLTRSVRK
ncbi:DedA family protein [Planococcus salinus]|uniref:DedA family protein n=1 Tax=Planococcus salinus TaxID=1848460 RepID=A0A3M8PAM3_9BACL|nr:DedA family protein [Planococcus salinus]RNF40759.1 DedA family protein [Planococcus salinus]